MSNFVTCILNNDKNTRRCQSLLNFRNYRSLSLIFLSLAVLWGVPHAAASPNLINLLPPSFEVNAMAVSPQGDVAAGSFYALDPTVVPWNLTNPIYNYVGVTLIASNLNNTNLSAATGINITSAANTLLPYHVILIVEGVQRNTQAIVANIQTLFGIPSTSSFEALTSNPFTLPVSVFASNFTSYSAFVNKFVTLTSAKSAMIGHYSSSLLLQSSSGIMFNSLESLTYPVSPVFSLSGLTSAVFGLTSIGAAIAPAFGLNSTGVVVLHKKVLTFSTPQDYTLGFGSLVGVTGGVYSTTNETFAAALPGGAQVKSFSPTNMIVQSGTGATLVVGVFPWVGTAARLVPDVTVTFHYPAFDSPILNASYTTNPSTPNVGQAFTLVLRVNNTGPVDAVSLHFSFSFTGAVLTTKPNITSIQYSLNSLPAGATNTTSFAFESYNPDPSLTLNVDYLDTANYVYHWNRQFTLAPNVKTNGPLTVTKTVSPSNPSYGQIGNVTVSIHNPSGNTYYNVEDLDPNAQLFIYPNGFNGNAPPPTIPCPYIPYYSSIIANSTHFNFQVGDNTGPSSCTPALLTRVSLQHGVVPTTQVATPNQLIGQGETWSPTSPYLIPGPALPGDTLVLTLTFLNFGNLTLTGFVGYTGPLPQLENPRTSYLGIYCQPCTIPRGTSTTISVGLFNSTGRPILGAPVTLSYRFDNNNTIKPIITQNTNSSGGFSYLWAASAVPIGNYQLLANYTGSASYDSSILSVPIAVTTPTKILPGGTITFSYPYFFNVTGTLNISAERIAYSSSINATGIGFSLMGEYATQSTSDTLTIGPPTIGPVVSENMNVQKISILYVAQNQSLVTVNLQVTNTGPQTANNVIVISLIPKSPGSGNGLGRSLPVVSVGPYIIEASNNRTVTFSPGQILPGASYSSWYVVRANATSFYETANNVTAQYLGNNYLFYYTGPLIVVYANTPPPTSPTPTGYLQAYETVNPAVVANNTSTTVTLHLYNSGNVTYSNINVTQVYSTPINLAPHSQLVPNMAPGTAQNVTFTGTAKVTGAFGPTGSTTANYVLRLSYNQSKTVGFQPHDFYQDVLVYDPTIPGFNPSLKVDISTPTPLVTAGTSAIAIETVTNTGTTPVIQFQSTLTSSSLLFNPAGPPTPQTSYGAYSSSWSYTIPPGQQIKFRIGIQTTAGGLYDVYASAAGSSEVFYTYQHPSGSITYDVDAFIPISSAALITATDTAAPTISNPWSSPFAPTSSDPVHVWSQVYDGSGISSVSLEYSTDRLVWNSVPMNPVFAPYLKGQSFTSPNGYVITSQPFFGDIYNATVPPEGPGAAVFYRIRSTDGLGNAGLSDNGGNDYVYFIQGGNSYLFNQPPATNALLNGTQYVSAIKTTVSLNVSTPIAVQVIQLGINPGGSPPSGLTALGAYTQINANLSITLSARLRFYYSNTQIAGLDPNTVTPYYWDGTKWTALTNVSRNTSQNYVEGSVNHFSLFGLFASPPQPQPPPSPASPFPWLIVGIIVAIAVVAIIGGVLVAARRRRGTMSLTQTPPSTPPPVPGTPSTP